MTGQAALALCDSAARFERRHRDAAVICGSHGGVYPACLAARHGLRAVILSDAGIGLEEAGVAGLACAQALGMAAAAVAHDSARIGDAADMEARGRLSRVNAVAAALGCAPGLSAREAATLMAHAPRWSGEPPPYREARHVVERGEGRAPVVLIDSASLVEPGDAGRIVVTGSHGGLIGGDPARALKVDALAAFFNDAGIGIEEAAVGRLPALDARGIAAATVSCDSARIGEARSSWETGVISRANRHARRAGAREGMTLGAFVGML